VESQQQGEAEVRRVRLARAVVEATGLAADRSAGA
jgi:hypothetical protein